MSLKIISQPKNPELVYKSQGNNDSINLIKFAQNQISLEMLAINKRIIELNTRLRECQRQKSSLDEDIRKIREKTEPPYFSGS